MTLIDLQGKALYSGDKEVQKAYLGSELMYKSLSGGISPVFYGNPSMALSTMEGTFNYYGGDDRLTPASPEDSYSFQDGGVYSPLDDYFTMPRYPTSTSGVTMELTFKMDMNLDLYYSSQLNPSNTNSGYSILSHKLNIWVAPIVNASTGVTQLALGGSNQYKFSTAYSKYSHDLNKITTIHFVLQDRYAYLYIDGEYKGLVRQDGLIGTNNVSVLGARHENGTRGIAMTVYDFKVYDYRLEDTNIQANYQNIQDRLQNI